MMKITHYALRITHYALRFTLYRRLSAKQNFIADPFYFRNSIFMLLVKTWFPSVERAVNLQK